MLFFFCKLCKDQLDDSTSTLTGKSKTDEIWIKMSINSQEMGIYWKNYPI